VGVRDIVEADLGSVVVSFTRELGPSGQRDVAIRLRASRIAKTRSARFPGRRGRSVAALPRRSRPVLCDIPNEFGEPLLSARPRAAPVAAFPQAFMAG
jgi:hypothetical protein